MKKILYKSVFAMALGFVSLAAVAQKDSTIIRQVLLERDYNPTLQDASKINTLPSIYSPIIKPKELKYLSSVPQISLANNKLGSAEPGDIKTGVDYSKKRGYLNLGAGSNSNIEGALGYRIVHATRDRLDIFATHSSTSGTVDYLQKNLELEDAKAKYSASKINLEYEHTFDPSILWIDASFYNTSYNYYGNPFIAKSSPEINRFDLDSRQNVDVFSVGAGLKSREESESILKYDAGITYQNFKNKYGYQVAGEGPKGGQIDLNANFFTDFGSDKSIGVKGWLMNQSFSDNSIYMPDAYHSLTSITATPYIKFQGSSWNADLGVNVSTVFDVKNKILFSPNLKAAIHIDEKNTFYAEATGGINNNTFLDILQENRYVNLWSRIEYSKTLYDLKAGFKSGVVEGFEFDIFAGYKQTDKDHLYIYQNNLENSLVSEGAWGNVSAPVYANIGTGNIGGLIKTNLIPYTDLSARLTAYFYNVKYKDAYVAYVGSPTLSDFSEKKAWGRPAFTAELNADVKPISNLTLSVNYLYAGGRKTIFRTSMVQQWQVLKMKDINELNFKGEYQLTDWLSVNARLNNILFQKYELQYGYP
ncbi:hypothetical protein JGH11_06305, partial [Dysgonomonas sp. Marseille-P4677]|uniref:hypothetical protein n=1 Tax=Dysgonomonas sp. Marseille-P4677 TaxID=2364790 RepID=UPI00191159A8